MAGLKELDNGGLEVWRGGVNTWECDEMGHMNVRFYVSRFIEGLAGLALRLGDQADLLHVHAPNPVMTTRRRGSSPSLSLNTPRTPATASCTTLRSNGFIGARRSG